MGLQHCCSVMYVFVHGRQYCTQAVRMGTDVYNHSFYFRRLRSIDGRLLGCGIDYWCVRMRHVTSSIWMCHCAVFGEECHYCCASAHIFLFYREYLEVDRLALRSVVGSAEMGMEDKWGVGMGLCGEW